MTQRKILVVEDERAIREMVCFNLGRAGYEAQPVADAREARDDHEQGAEERHGEVRRAEARKALVDPPREQGGAVRTRGIRDGGR